MARTPQNNEAFFREVDDEVRRERVEKAARRYGVIVGLIVLLALAALGGTLWWRNHQQAVAGERGEQLIAAMSALNAGQEDAARKQLQGLIATGAKGYTPLARLLLADMAVRDNKPQEASTAFMALARDDDAPREIRDVALLRATLVDFDRIAPIEVIDRLKPLAIPGTPWFGPAGEMSGIAYMKLNQPKQAGALFAQVAKDPGVPHTLRARVAQLAGEVGVEIVQPADSPES